jgi:peptidoglycan/xylan/chitin deacetylase (PgdA/CDA1 family)
MSIPVLMYHSLYTEDKPSGVTDPQALIYDLPFDAFKNQMQQIKDSGKTGLSFKNYQESNNKNQSVILTFDDGHRSNLTLAAPYLKNLGFSADFFITTDFINTANFLTDQEVTELQKLGMSVGSHSKTHKLLGLLSEKETWQELQLSHIKLSSLIESVTTFSAPGGSLPKDLDVLLDQMGYSHIFTSILDFYDPDSEKKTLLPYIPRIPIKNQTSIHDFNALIQCASSAIIRAQIKQRMINSIRSNIGEKNYHRIKNWVLKNTN